MSKTNIDLITLCFPIKFSMCVPVLSFFIDAGFSVEFEKSGFFTVEDFFRFLQYL